MAANSFKQMSRIDSVENEVGVLTAEDQYTLNS